MAKPHQRKMRNIIGCHIANNKPECCRGCGGWYKKYDQEMMLHLLKTGKLDPKRMPCGILERQATELLDNQRKLC